MAKKNKNEERINYKQTLAELKSKGPERLYLLWGEEDYLTDSFAGELRKACVGEEPDSFSYRRINERDYTPESLADAIDSVPFLSERSFVELRGIDLNRLRDREAEELLRAVKDIPDYCTVAFVQSAQFEPDKRLRLIKTLLSSAKELQFTAQSGDALINWIVRRFSAEGKRIELEAAQRLISVSGELMNRLIPEIAKVAAFASGEIVTVRDVETVAHHIPEAVIFDMTDRLAEGRTDAAIELLAELLADKDNEPIQMLAVLGAQMRKLYGARMAIESGQGKDYVMKNCGVRFDSVASRLIAAARRFSTARLADAVELCADTDHLMKSSGVDSAELLKDCVLRIAAGE